MKRSLSKGWSVGIDKERCTLCEVCAVRCPTGALSLSRTGAGVSLRFTGTLCDGCGGAFPCRSGCPEKILTIERTARASSERPRILAKGRIVRCSLCGALIASQKKVDRALRAKGVSAWCPACRRNRLIRNLIA